MRRKITVTLIIIVCFLLQSTLFKALSFASFGFMRGRKEGIFIGFFSGLLIDIFFGEMIGFYALLYMYAGFLNGCFKKMFYPDDIKLPMLLIAGSDLSYNLFIYFFRFLFRKQFAIGYYMLHIIIPELVYTLLISVVLYFIILKINQRLERIEKRSAAKFV